MDKLSRGMEKLSDRVRYVVDLYWGGSVNAAAKALGVSQPSLHRLVTGKLTDPRLSMLRLIADNARISYEWLSTGHGETPRPLDEHGYPIQGATLAWADLLRELGLTAIEQRAMMEVASGPLQLSLNHFFAVVERSLAGGVTDAEMEQARLDFAPTLAAQDAVYGAWRALLELLIEREGKEAVAQKISADLPIFANGYTGFARRQYKREAEAEGAEARRARFDREFTAWTQASDEQVAAMDAQDAQDPTAWTREMAGSSAKRTVPPPPPQAKKRRTKKRRRR